MIVFLYLTSYMCCPDCMALFHYVPEQLVTDLMLSMCFQGTSSSSVS